MKKDTNTEFLSILMSNDLDKLHNFMIINGKGPKPYCPISFDNTETINEISTREENTNVI